MDMLSDSMAMGLPPRYADTFKMSNPSQQAGGAAVEILLTLGLAPLRAEQRIAESLDAAAGGTTTVIGKLDDLKNLATGERSLLDRLPNLGSPKANWEQNSGVLRQEMELGRPIRDASVDSAGALINNTGFLRAERALLESRGWTYDPRGTMWYPPGP